VQTVDPKSLECWRLVNPFSNFKKYTIWCGGCGNVYRDKLFIGNKGRGVWSEMRSRCPVCGIVNKWESRRIPLGKEINRYDK